MGTDVPICIGRDLEFLFKAFSGKNLGLSRCLAKLCGVSIFILKFALFAVITAN